jgi:hypothetical protein
MGMQTTHTKAAGPSSKLGELVASASLSNASLADDESNMLAGLSPEFLAKVGAMREGLMALPNPPQPRRLWSYMQIMLRSADVELLLELPPDKLAGVLEQRLEQESHHSGNVSVRNDPRQADIDAQRFEDWCADAQTSTSRSEPQ